MIPDANVQSLMKIPNSRIAMYHSGQRGTLVDARGKFKCPLESKVGPPQNPGRRLRKKLKTTAAMKL
jgi:hypothetical protein